MPINQILLTRTAFAVKDIQLFNAATGTTAPSPVGSVQPPAALKPQLFLVEHYRLTSFKGDLARDEMIGSFSLSPHSELTYTLIQKTTTSKDNELTTTVMESQDVGAAQQFNSHLKDSADSKFGKNTSDYSFDASFHGEAEVGFGSGSADADVHAKGASQDVHDEMAKSTESALDSQISATNQFRSQQARAGKQSEQATSSNETKIEKKTRNDSGEPINIGIFQLKEEVITILSLVDVEVAFRNTNTAQDRTVPIRQLDSLLDAVIAGAEARATLKRQIKVMLDNVRDFRDEARSIVVADPENPNGFTTNRRLESKYDLKATDGTVRRTLTVPGIIIKDYRRFLRKPNTTVELRMETI